MHARSVVSCKKQLFFRHFAIFQKFCKHFSSVQWQCSPIQTFSACLRYFRKQFRIEGCLHFLWTQVHRIQTARETVSRGFLHERLTFFISWSVERYRSMDRYRGPARYSGPLCGKITVQKRSEKIVLWTAKGLWTAIGDGPLTGYFIYYAHDMCTCTWMCKPYEPAHAKRTITSIKAVLRYRSKWCMSSTDLARSTVTSPWIRRRVSNRSKRYRLVAHTERKLGVLVCNELLLVNIGQGIAK